MLRHWRWIIGFVLLALGVTGCSPAPQGPPARGAASVDDLVQQYVTAHQTQDFTLLRELLLWHADIGGVMRGARESDESLRQIQALDLEEVRLVKYPVSNLPSGTRVDVTYTRPKPSIPGGVQTDGVLGPWVAKLVLKGTTLNQQGQRVPIEIDPSLLIREFNGRYFIYATPPVLAEAADAVVHARPQVSTPQPVTHQVETVAWTRGQGLVATASPGPPAREASSVDDLVQRYISAHRAKDFSLLRDLLLWHGDIGGVMHGVQKDEERLKEILALELDEVTLVRYPVSNVPAGVRVSYMRHSPRGRMENFAGPWIAKLILKGSVLDQQGQCVELEIDPSLLIRQLNGRYYMYATPPVLADAAVAVVHARRQTYKSYPVPRQTETIVWNRDEGRAASSPSP